MEHSRRSNAHKRMLWEAKPVAPKRKSNSVPGRKRGWKKPEGKPKRPLSAYNLFFQEEKKHVQREGKVGFAALARKIAAKWKTLSTEDRSPYKAKAEVEKARYKKEVKAWEEQTKTSTENVSFVEMKLPSIEKCLPVGISTLGPGHLASTSAYFAKNMSLLGSDGLPTVLAAGAYPPRTKPSPSFMDELDSVISEISDDIDETTKSFEPLPLFADDIKLAPIARSSDKSQLGTMEDYSSPEEAISTVRSLHRLASVMDEECFDLMRSLLKPTGS